MIFLTYWAFSKVNHLETKCRRGIVSDKAFINDYLLRIVRCSFLNCVIGGNLRSVVRFRNIATNISHDLHQKDNNNNVPVYQQ